MKLLVSIVVISELFDNFFENDSELKDHIKEETQGRMILTSHLHFTSGQLLLER